MHLDTVCTMVDVDAVVMYPNIADTLRGLHRHQRRRAARERPGAVPRGRREGDGHRHAAGDRHRPGPDHRRARAVGRRQQHPRRSGPGWRWPTSATSRPTPGSRTPASRWSGSPAASSAAAAAARGACPARSAGTRSAADRTAGRTDVPTAAADMEGPERNRRGMQQRSGLAATISEVPTQAEQPIRCAPADVRCPPPARPVGPGQRRVSCRLRSPARARRSASSSGLVSASASAEPRREGGHRLLQRLGRGALGEVPDRHHQAVRAERPDVAGALADRVGAGRVQPGQRVEQRRPRRAARPSAGGSRPRISHQYAASTDVSRTVGTTASLARSIEATHLGLRSSTPSSQKSNPSCTCDRRAGPSGRAGPAAGPGPGQRRSARSACRARRPAPARARAATSRLASPEPPGTCRPTNTLAVLPHQAGPGHRQHGGQGDARRPASPRSGSAPRSRPGTISRIATQSHSPASPSNGRAHERLGRLAGRPAVAGLVAAPGPARARLARRRRPGTSPPVATAVPVATCGGLAFLAMGRAPRGTAGRSRARLVRGARPAAPAVQRHLGPHGDRLAASVTPHWRLTVRTMSRPRPPRLDSAADAGVRPGAGTAVGDLQVQDVRLRPTSDTMISPEGSGAACLTALLTSSESTSIGVVPASARPRRRRPARRRGRAGRAGPRCARAARTSPTLRHAGRRPARVAIRHSLHRSRAWHLSVESPCPGRRGTKQRCRA